ncbi:MAG TPA: 50S ribosomal protein L11 methyltransferase [Nitrospiria bacterium]|nr:50S ribosomal protein L11 methyltransferase [Nitrospiria bacterium]
MSWISISLRIKPEFAEILGEALIARGSVGVWESQPGWLTAYFPAASDPRAVKELLEGMSVSFGQGDCLIAPVSDQDWIATWKASVTPLRVTPRLTIVPSWSRYSEEPGEQVVILDPEMAFGTGHHETTRMCLELLDERLQRGDHPAVFDLGTGSGILAIAAAKLGSGRVVACDTDPLACETASRNVEANAVPDTVSVKDAEAGWKSGPYDLIVANLTAEDLCALMPRIAAVLAPNGEAILSGILTSRDSIVNDAVGQAGLQVMQRRQQGEWTALQVGTRR